MQADRSHGELPGTNEWKKGVVVRNPERIVDERWESYTTEHNVDPGQVGFLFKAPTKSASCDIAYPKSAEYAISSFVRKRGQCVDKNARSVVCEFTKKQMSVSGLAAGCSRHGQHDAAQRVGLT